LIVDSRLDLYRDERATMPLADVVKAMRRHIRFEVSPPRAGEIVFRVRFSYSDPQKAQRTANALSIRFLQMPNAGVTASPASAHLAGFMAVGAVSGRDALARGPRRSPGKRE
jgi:hypothetical protein